MLSLLTASRLPPSPIVPWQHPLHSLKATAELLHVFPNEWPGILQWLSFTEFFLEVPFEYLELPDPLLSSADNVHLHELAIAVWKVLRETEQEPAFPELCNTVEGLLHLPPGELLKVRWSR